MVNVRLLEHDFGDVHVYLESSINQVYDELIALYAEYEFHINQDQDVSTYTCIFCHFSLKYSVLNSQVSTYFILIKIQMSTMNLLVELSLIFVILLSKQRFKCITYNKFMYNGNYFKLAL